MAVIHSPLPIVIPSTYPSLLPFQRALDCMQLSDGHWRGLQQTLWQGLRGPRLHPGASPSPKASPSPEASTSPEASISPAASVSPVASPSPAASASPRMHPMAGGPKATCFPTATHTWTLLCFHAFQIHPQISTEQGTDVRVRSLQVLWGDRWLYDGHHGHGAFDCIGYLPTSFIIAGASDSPAPSASAAASASPVASPSPVASTSPKASPSPGLPPAGAFFCVR